MKTAQERLKFIFQYTGTSPKSLTEILELKSNIILNLNKGAQKSFSYATAKAINKLYKFSIDWIMDGEGEIFEEPENTLERRALNLDELLSKTNEIGKIFDFIRTVNNLSIEEYLKILEMTKERYLEICLENALPNMKEAILIKANFNVKIDDFLFDENGDIKKMIGEKSDLNEKLTNLSPMQIAIIRNHLKK